MGLHKNLIATDNHVPFGLGPYANAAARTGATGFVAADVGKFALQSDDNSIWMLTATTPTWSQVNSGGGGAVSSVFTRTGAVVAVAGDYGANQVSFTPAGNIAATDVQAAIVEVRNESVQDGDAAGGDLTGTYPNPTVAALAITDAKVAAANKDGTAGTPSLRTLGTGAAQAAAGNDSRLSDSRAPNGSATGDLTGTYPAPTIAALAVTDAKVATANKDGTAGTPSMRTLGTGALQATAGNDSRLSDSRAPTGSATGDLTGTYPAPTIAALAVTDAKVAAANKDGASGTPSMRTLGTGAAQAAAGNDSRLSDSRAPNGSAGGQLGGTYPNPDVRGLRETAGPTSLTMGAVADGQLFKRSGSNIIGVDASFALRDVSLFDHFVQGSTSSGNIGSAGWILAATGTGNNQAVSGEANHPGIFVNTNGTALAARSGIHLGDTTLRNILATSGNTNPLVFDCMVKPVGVAAANLLRHQFGLGSGWALANPNPLTDGIYIRLEPGTSNNWQGVCANSSTRSTVNLGVAASGTWVRLGFIYTPTGTPQVQFYVDGVATGSPITTNIPTGLVGPGFRSDSGNGTAVDLNIDYVLMSQITP